MSGILKWLERLALPSLLIIFIILLFISKKENKYIIEKSINTKIDTKYHKIYPTQLEQFNKENIFSIENTTNYIEYVINHGSSWLHYKGGVMEGGYISAKDAHMVACYVVHLSGRECKEGYPKEAQMYFSSVCAGCHGNDGKGLGGNYPDLTKKELDGLKRIYQNH